MPDTPTPGQRWISKTEPELGLGVLLELDHPRVTILFPTAEERRVYALKNAPIMRATFKAGDEVPLHSGEVISITEVEEIDGILHYHTADKTVPETELSDTITFSNPDDRLLTGQVGELRTFNLRAESLFRSSQIKKSPVRGLLGGRIDLIPHQIHIANEVASRPHPRALLADEVGLGKTIEACLILHRLHLTGRANRILILLPDALVHQWFVELYRRFNLTFTIFDEERCQAITAQNPELNPFLENQLILCSTDFLLAYPERIPQALEASWDLLIVDEAHHLDWSPEEPSEAYELVDSLAADTPSVLLLTATPQQLGQQGHFARLRLLDPDRYNDLDHFLEESDHYEEVARLIDLIQNGDPIPSDLIDRFAERSPRIARGLAGLDDEKSRQQTISDLLDSFGTGRVMFRNTRKELTGFPERKAHLIELEGDKDGEGEFNAKLEWLVDFLKKNPDEKVLLICKTLELVEELAVSILDKVDLNLAQFHEELTLLQRDRNAAYFSEKEGAQILLCSEIGSEGRNFQFAHHLVLFDITENPELLEQRIGRLDRIGQTQTIHIHIPFTPGSRDGHYAKWYHEALNAFEKNLHGAQILIKRLQALETKTVDEFMEASIKIKAETDREMEHGHDRLLALTSRADENIEPTLELIDDWDSDRNFEDWITKLLDFFGVKVEELGDRAYLLKPGNVITDAFPDLPDTGLAVTFDRQRALSREEIGFMSADHPIVRSAIDLLLTSEAGNTAFGVWESPGEPTMILEAYFIIECLAPPHLQTDRFLPPVPIRLAVDHKKNDLSKDKNLIQARLRPGKHRKLLEQQQITQELLPSLLSELESLAQKHLQSQIKKATEAMHQSLDLELARLNDLREVNPMIGDPEIQTLKDQKQTLQKTLAQARTRLDSLRLIYKKP